MRICYLVTSLETGGAEFAIPPVVDVLARCGHRVDVVVCEPRDMAAAPLLNAAGIGYTLLSRRRLFKPAGAARFARWVRRHRPDLIWTSLSAATLIGQLVGRAFGIPVVSWKHSSAVKRYLRWSHPLTALWVADSADVATYLQREMGVEPARIATWPLFVPPPCADLPRWTGREPLRIGSAGRLHPQKRYDLLLHAVALLRRRDPALAAHLRVSVAGEGPERPALSALAAELGIGDSVDWVGFTGDIPGFLAGLHLYVQCSDYEGMCIAAHEAMAVGLPIVATGVGQLRHSVEPGVNGLLVAPGSATALADAIAELAACPARLATLGAAGAARMTALYGADRFFRNGQAVLAQVDGLRLGACLASRAGRKRAGNERAGA